MTSPTITNDEVVFAGVLTIHSVSVSGSVTYDDDAVVNFVTGVAAMKETFGHDTRVVRTHHSGGSDTSTDGLVLKHNS